MEKEENSNTEVENSEAKKGFGVCSGQYLEAWQ